MHRIDTVSNVASLPAVATPGTPGYFLTGDGSTTQGTQVDGDWFNMVQEELVAILTAASITPDATKASFNQVITAIKALIAASQGNFRVGRNVNADTVFTSDDFGSPLHALSTTPTDITFTIAAPPGLGGACNPLSNNSAYNVTVTVDGATPYFNGLTAAGPWAGSAAPSFVLPAKSSALIYARGGYWLVFYNSAAFMAVGSGFGTGVTNHSGGHSLGVTYTNTTGKEKFVQVYSKSSADADNLNLTVDGTTVSSMGQQTHGSLAQVCGFVPPGSTYAVSWQTGTGSGTNWNEAY